MNMKELDGIQIWKPYEDLLIPGLRLSVIERAVHSQKGERRAEDFLRWLYREGR